MSQSGTGPMSADDQLGQDLILTATAAVVALDRHDPDYLREAATRLREHAQLMIRLADNWTAQGVRGPQETGPSS